MTSSKTGNRTRRKPRQARAVATYEAILEGAARVFKREGWDATTNRIAEEAGVGIGSVYEYFPNKQALIVALAERHVDVAQATLEPLLARPIEHASTLLAIQEALVHVQRYPSQALQLITGDSAVGVALRERATALEAKLLRAFEACAATAGHDDAEVRAIFAFEALGLGTIRASERYPEHYEALARCHRQAAQQHLGLGAKPR